MQRFEDYGRKSTGVEQMIKKPTGGFTSLTVGETYSTIKVLRFKIPPVNRTYLTKRRCKIFYLR